MEPGHKTPLDAKAKILKALAHPTRVMIVECLAAGEKCVGELAEKSGADFSTVSKHLLILEDAWIISGVRRGRRIFYRLEMPGAAEFTNSLTARLRESLEVKIALLK